MVRIVWQNNSRFSPSIQSSSQECLSRCTSLKGDIVVYCEFGPPRKSSSESSWSDRVKLGRDRWRFTQ